MFLKNLQFLSKFSKHCKSSNLFFKRGNSNGLSYFHYIGKEPLVYRTLGQQINISAKQFDNEAIVSFHEGKRLTYPQLLPEVDRISAGLLKLGLKRGDYVAIWGPNTMTWYLSMLAAARAGLVSVAINPSFQGPEVEYCLKKTNCKAVISPESYRKQNYYEILKSICPNLTESKPGSMKCSNLPHLKSVIIDTPTKLKGIVNFEHLLDLSSTAEINEIAKIQKQIIPDAPCNVQFTSGTTGLPKAAVISHYNIVNNGIHIGNRNQYAGERICGQNPLFHAYGIVITIAGLLTHGGTLVMPAAGFSPKDSLRAIVEEKCTVIHGTPTMYVDLVKAQKELQLPLETAKRAITGGAPCAPQLFLDMKEYLGLEEVRSVFGLSETTAVIFQSRSTDTTEQILNTVGYVQDHVEVKVTDIDGNTVPFGVPGELCVRGYCNMLGYYDDELKTKDTIGQDRWLRTGDQFVLQEDGYGRIVGRLKDMVIRGGENLFPKEIEDFLSTHPDIIEAHVVGVPDERMGEEICAFVRLRAGVENMNVQNLKEYSKGKISHFKVPRYIFAVDDFPKTTSGKIQKFQLKEIFLKQYDQQK